MPLNASDLRFVRALLAAGAGLALAAGCGGQEPAAPPPPSVAPPEATPAPEPADVQPLAPVETDYPYASIGNRHVGMAVYLPDAEKGYYRGHRFDWSGLVARAEYAGHTFFGPWQSPHRPTVHDHAIGTAEEFGMRSPPGYDEAKSGEPFLKIGIGVFEKRPKDPAKPETDTYRFHGTYPLLKLGTWDVEREADRIAFHQTLEYGGWAYRYTKRVRLTEDGFLIRRRLENSGTRAIATRHYGHHFIAIDDRPVGPAYEVVFGFEPEADPLIGPVRLDGRALAFTEELGRDQSAFARLSGFESDPAHHAAVVICREAGAALRIRGDRPPVDWQFYAQSTAACPEPFVEVDLEPGRSMEWQTAYTFQVYPQSEPETRAGEDGGG